MGNKDKLLGLNVFVQYIYEMDFAFLIGGIAYLLTYKYKVEEVEVLRGFDEEEDIKESTNSNNSKEIKDKSSIDDITSINSDKQNKELYYRQTQYKSRISQ